MDGPAVQLTNADWVIEGARIGRDFGLSRAVVVNDYVPVAAGAAGIKPTDLTPIGPRREEGRPGDQGARLVLGPGTGFGAAALLPWTNASSSSPPRAATWISGRPRRTSTNSGRTWSG